MTFQARLTLALLAIAAIPLGILGYGIRRELTSRIDAEAARQVGRVQAQVTARVAAIATDDRGKLESLAADLATDRRFAIAVSNDSSPERVWLAAWAGATMKLTGLAMLRVQDSTGATLSSGSFYDEFERIPPATAATIAASPARAAVVDTRTSAGSARVLATIATFAVRGDTFRVMGGTPFDSTRVAGLSPDSSIAARLQSVAAESPEGAIAVVRLPLVDELTAEVDTLQLFLTPDLSETVQLRAGVTRWLWITLSGTVVAAILAAMLIGRFASAPLDELAARTETLDLSKLDVKFFTGRDDELGALERTLDALTGRLRTSVSRLREVERAAATGELARQVNHDIKNGLTPIRNVLRHLAQAAEKDPASVAAIYLERRATIESGIEYLDQLARNYARLSPALGRALTDPRAIVLEVAGGVTGPAVKTDVPEVLPLVRADAVVLRRILENIVSNAVDALDGQPGTITIAASASNHHVRFTVADSGKGMTKQELDRAFDDFYTTKPAGTGLGLSVVRRLLTDIGGSIRAETAPGQGSTFTVELPTGDA